MERLISGRSSAVHAVTTPGTALAASTPILMMLAGACRLLTKAMWSKPGRERSSTKRPVHVMSRWSSLRRGEAPIRSWGGFTREVYTGARHDARRWRLASIMREQPPTLTPTLSLPGGRGGHIDSLAPGGGEGQGEEERMTRKRRS